MKGKLFLVSTRNSAKVMGCLLTALFLMFGTVSIAQERENVRNTDISDFNEWDANTDQELDRDEFNTRVGESGMYNDWADMEEGTITQDRFNEGIFNRWDADRDGTLTREEYTTGNAAWETEYGNNFDTWDADRDGTLNNDEFNTGFNETDVYNNWDADRDGALNEDEFNEGLFNIGDRDRSGSLDNDEFNQTDYNSWRGTDNGEMNQNNNNNNNKKNNKKRTGGGK